jgi:hypothetical protein
VKGLEIFGGVGEGVCHGDRYQLRQPRSLTIVASCALNFQLNCIVELWCLY